MIFFFTASARHVSQGTRNKQIALPRAGTLSALRTRQILVESPSYCRKECRIIEHSRTRRFGSSAQHNNDKLFGGVDVEMLSKYPSGFKSSCVKRLFRRHGPPEIAIVNRLAADAMGRASLLEPSFGDGTAAVNHAIGKYEKTETSIIS